MSIDTQSVNTRIFAGSAWESKVGYCRVRRVGQFVYVSGVVAADSNGNAVSSDCGQQTRDILDKISNALIQAGGKLSDVVRSRVFLTDISDFDKVATVHGQYYSNIQPAMACYEIKGLVKPEFKVEIEADAVIQ